MIERKTIAITQLVITDEDVVLDTVQGVNYDVKNTSTGSIKLTLNGTEHTLETGVVAVVVDGEIAHFIGGELTATNIRSHGYVTAARLYGYLPGHYITGMLGYSTIPNLSASKITSGILSSSRVPNLSASKITSGTLSLSRIPWEITGKKVWGAVAN